MSSGKNQNAQWVGGCCEPGCYTRVHGWVGSVGVRVSSDQCEFESGLRELRELRGLPLGSGSLTQALTLALALSGSA